MDVVYRCHLCVREMSPHVVTFIQIEDEEGVTDKITRNVTSIEQKIGRPGAGNLERRTA